MTQLLFLRIYKGSELVAVKQFQEGQIIFGTAGDVNLQLEGHGIALVHGMIEERNGQFYIGDLGSEGGTKLNGKNILDHVLESGDVIEVGDCKIEFHIGLPKPKAAPPGVATQPPMAEVPPTQKSPPPNPSKQVETQAKKPTIPSSPKKEESRPSPTPVARPSQPSQAMVASGGMETHRPSTKKIERANYGTYAPPSKHTSVYEIVKPSKGNIVELMVLWGERVMETHQFNKAQVVNVGSHPKNAIVLPVFGSPQISHPLLKIDAMATIYLTDAMTIEVTREKDSRRLNQNDLRAENRLIPTGTGTAISLQQGEMAKIDFGAGLSIIIRYTSSIGTPLAAPLLDFTSSELVGLVTIMAISAILGLYLLIYAPNPQEEEELVQEPERKAVFLVKRQRVEVSVDDATQGLKNPTTTEKKAVQTAQEGAASEAAPNKSQSQEKKPTTPNPGTATGIQKGSIAKSNKPNQKEAAGSVGPKAKDVTKTGLLSVFGKAGTQAALRNAEKGTGLVGGLGSSASGQGATVARGAGTVEGLGTKDLGAGGKGESTVGISGVKTKGRGGGNAGYGTGNLGEKGRAAVTVGGEGESFTGTIDKEGIRRVVRQNQREIQACYEQALNKDPSLNGKVVLEWEIGERGKVGAVKVLNSSLGSRIVEQCMMTALKRWTFPEPPPDQIAVVAFPFVFMSQQ